MTSSDNPQPWVEYMKLFMIVLEEVDIEVHDLCEVGYH